MLNHTHFGNGVLAIWNDRGRWEGVKAAACGKFDRWAPRSREAWAHAFERWRSVGAAMLASAANVEEAFAPLNYLVGLAQDSDVLRRCVRVATDNFRREARLDAWQTDVREAVARVDAAVAALPNWMRSGAALDRRLEPRGVLIEQLLEPLSAAGARLKEVFSGNGYFAGVNAE